jgi:hypothetical protein
MCIHCLCHLTIPLPPPPPAAASGQSLFYPIVLWFCWRENITDNKKDIVFLLVWDKDSYTERFLALLPCTSVLQPKLVHLYQISSLLPSPLPIVALGQFKITLLALLQWAHQPHVRFRFPSLSLFLLSVFPLSVWPMSNNITAFVLCLQSIYEGEHVIFGLLSLANFA